MLLSLPPSYPGPTPAEGNCWLFSQFFSKYVLFILLPEAPEPEVGAYTPKPRVSSLFPVEFLVSCAVPSGTWAGEDIAPVWVLQLSYSSSNLQLVNQPPVTW